MSESTHFPKTGSRAWLRVGALLLAVGWGANHFAALLPVYRARLQLDAGGPALLFGAYALGLVPGLLLSGPLSDRHGRRAIVLPSAALALATSLVLGLSGASFERLLFGRMLYGVAAGGAISSGAAWLVELSHDTSTDTASQRATVALTAGFGLGPLVSGTLAEYAPAPTFTPFALHGVLLAVALLCARTTPNAAPAAPAPTSRAMLRIELGPRAWSNFLRGVAPMAPFVFAFPAITFATLPSLLLGSLGSAPLVFTGVLCAVSLLTGAVAQPITRRFDPTTAARLGLVSGAAGALFAAFAVATQAGAALLFVAAVMGVAYGVCMTAGLQTVQRIAPPEARGGLTGLYYVLTYLGFAAPYLMTLADRALEPTTSLGMTAFVATTVAVLLRRPK